MNNKCPICSGKLEKIRVFSDVDQINLMSCRSCHAECLDPQPNDVRLAKEYQSYYQKRSSKVESPKVPYFQNLLKNLQTDLNNKRILEIGGGEGDFARALLGLFPQAELTVIESNPENQKYFQDLQCKMINQSVEDYIQKTSEKFDFVFLFDVIEHLRDPVKSTGELIRLLSPEGRLVATFPNSESLSRKCLGPLWPQYKMEHLFYFSRKSIEAIAKLNNSYLESLRPLTKELPVDYLLSVGSNFGPKPLQKTMGLATQICPNFLRSKNVKIKLGEWLMVMGNRPS